MGTAQTTAMDIFKQLPRTNCRECGLPTCLAFAAAVIKGEIELRACPEVPSEVMSNFSGAVVEKLRDDEQERVLQVEQLKAQMSQVDLAAAADRLGATMHDDRLAIRCLGRFFELDPDGNLHSELHINPWVHGPILDHVINGSGTLPTGEWVPFSELDCARDWIPFFSHRCEGGLAKLAGEDPDLFFNVLDLFGNPIPEEVVAKDPVIASADSTVLLHPLPRIPLLLCFWQAEDGFESRLVLRFDSTAGENVGGGSLYVLCQGLVEMFRRIMSRHGHTLAT